MDFIGGEMDELASTGYRGGSTAGGPLSNPTQFGPVGDKESVPFEGQQRQCYHHNVVWKKLLNLQ